MKVQPKRYECECECHEFDMVTCGQCEDWHYVRFVQRIGGN